MSESTTAEFASLFVEPLRNGVSYPSRERGSGVPMVNMKEIFAYDRISDQECELAPLSDKELDTYCLEAGDLLFARQSLTYDGAGRCVLVMPSEKVRTWESHLIRVRLDINKADPGYYFNYFRSRLGRRSIESIIQQVAAAGIRGSDLARLTVPCPPIEEQQAVAEVLAALDDKIAANTKLSETASAFAQALYEQGVMGVEMQPMSAVLTPVLGGTPARASSEFWGGNHWWASAKDITGANNAVIISTEESISAAAVKRTKAKPLPIDSVIVTARGTVGAVARLAVPASFNQSCYGFTPDQAPPAILYFGIVNAMQRAKAIAHGSVFDTITMRTFDHLEFPAFADGVAEELDRKIGPLLDSVVAKVKESRALAEMRDTLLPELMSGRLRVKDAEKKIEEVV